MRKWLVRLTTLVSIALLAVCLSWIFSPCHDPDYQQANAPAANDDCASFSGVVIAGVSSAADWIGALKPEIWTAIATAVVAAFTAALWHISGRQLNHARMVERAYLWGGGGLDREKRCILELTINNYGKTSGLLKQYAVGFCSRGDIPLKPDYGVLTDFHDWIPPNPTLIRPIDRIDPKRPITADLLIYGRFWFVDIWGDKHSTGFVLAIVNADDHTTRDTSGIIPAGVNFPEAYTKWW